VLESGKDRSITQGVGWEALGRDGSGKYEDGKAEVEEENAQSIDPNSTAKFTFWL